jgi:hypothetical protein
MKCVCGLGDRSARESGQEGQPMTSTKVAQRFKMGCVDKPQAPRPPPKRLSDDLAEPLSGLLPDEALQDAVRGLDPARSPVRAA